MESVAPLTFLGGRVWKQTLPMIKPPAGPGTPAVKRLQLPQGELAQVFDADEGARFIAVIELREGTVRGNHVHQVKREFIYIMTGECLLVLEDLESKERARIPLVRGDLVFIPPRIAHAVHVTRPGEAVEWSPDRFDPNDTTRHPIE